MPVYAFSLPLAVEAELVELENDRAAWAQAVQYCGELLKDIDGDLPKTSDWTLNVSEGKRDVASIHVSARLKSEEAHPLLKRRKSVSDRTES